MHYTPTNQAAAYDYVGFYSNNSALTYSHFFCTILPTPSSASSSPLASDNCCRKKLNAEKQSFPCDRFIGIYRMNVNLYMESKCTEQIMNKRNFFTVCLRVNYAAARIQGIIRGFLTRCKYEKLVQAWRAAIAIQRILRGKLGKMVRNVF